MSDNNGRYSVDFKLTVNTVSFNLKVNLKLKLNVNRVFSQLTVNTVTFTLKVKLNVNRVSDISPDNYIQNRIYIS